MKLHINPIALELTTSPSILLLQGEEVPSKLELNWPFYPCFALLNYKLETSGVFWFYTILPLNPTLKIISHLSTNLLKIGLVLFSNTQTHFGKASHFSITTCSIQPQSNLGFVLFPNLFPSLNSTPSPKVPLQRNILQSKSDLH